MVGNTDDKMDLTTTNAATFQSHPKQATVKTQPRDHTSTFLDKEQAMKGCSTYMRSYVEKPDATRPGAFKPGPPENFIALEMDSRLPNSVTCETYRNYGEAEQRSAKRKSIILPDEYSYIPNPSTSATKVSLYHSPVVTGLTNIRSTFQRLMLTISRNITNINVPLRCAPKRMEFTTISIPNVNYPPHMIEHSIPTAFLQSVLCNVTNQLGDRINRFLQ